MKNKTFLYVGSAALLIAFFLIATMTYKNNQQKELSFIANENAETFVRDYSPRYGDADAKVFITEYLDPECESCRVFYPQVKELLKEYEGKVQLVVRYAPFHKNSVIAIRALEAARIQGKYWEALELLFEKQPEWGDHHNPQPNKIFEYLPALGLDMKKLDIDMQKPEIMMNLKQDVQDLRTLNVRGTPTFFVNGKSPEGFGIQFVKALIDKELTGK